MLSFLSVKPIFALAVLGKRLFKFLLEKLPICPIISTLNTATYHLAIYWAKLLSLLSTSEYTVSSSKEFLTTIKNVQVPPGFHMVSFDVELLFTNVPLEYTIGLLLERIYNKGELVTNITRSEMKEMLLCMKNVHFSYNHDIYIQKDGVAMGSLLGSVLAGIFMVNLERSLVPKLNVYMNFWRCYVDYTITFIKIGSLEYLLSVLNNFHQNIKFRYEMEVESKLAFLDILLHRDGHGIIITVYRKVTNNDVYLNRYSFCLREWKEGTFRSLVQQAYIISSSLHLLKEELKHLEDVFVMKNNFPIWVVKKILKEEKEKIDNKNNADKNKRIFKQM